MTTLENPVTGERFTFTEISEERLAFDFALREGLLEGKDPTRFQMNFNMLHSGL